MLRIRLLPLLAALALPANAAAAPKTIDGPSAAVAELGNLAVAPDGTGGVAYLKTVGTVKRVFVATLANGTWSAPQQLAVAGQDAKDALLPRLAAGNGGRLAVTFKIDEGGGIQPNDQLWTAVKPAGGAFGAASALNANPAAKYADVAMNAAGAGYLAYVDFAFHIRAARLQGTTWTEVGAAYPGAAGALNKDATKQAGVNSGQDEPRLTVAGNGDGILAWAEDSGSATDKLDVVVRRLAGAAAGDIGPAQTADIPALNGFTSAGNADMMDVDADQAGNATVVFRELFTYGAQDVPRALTRRLTGNALGPATLIDGLVPNANPNTGAEFPRIDVNAFGGALVAMPRQNDNEIRAAAFTGTWSALGQVSAIKENSPPAPVVGFGDAGRGLIAWLHQPVAMGPFSVDVRRRDGAAFGSERTVSSAADGSVGALPGPRLDAGSTAGGTGWVAYTQGAAATSRIVVADVPVPPPPPATDPKPPTGTPKPAPKPTFGRTTRVALTLTKGGTRASKKYRLTVKVKNANAFRVTGAAKLTRGKVRYATRKKVALAAKTSTRVTFTLGRAARKAIKARRKVLVRATFVLTSPRGTSRTVVRRFNVLRPKR